MGQSFIRPSVMAQYGPFPSITALYLQNIKTFQLFNVQMCYTRMDWSYWKGAVKMWLHAFGEVGVQHTFRRETARERERERGGPPKMPSTHHKSIYLLVFLSGDKRVAHIRFFFNPSFFAKISATIHPRREKIHFQNPAKKKKKNWGGKRTKSKK